MPKAFDLYERWQVPSNREEPLTSFQRAFVLSVLPDGGEILEARPARSWGFYPIRIRIATADGEQIVFLRKDQKVGGVELEAALLPVLLKHGLPVPKLLGGPIIDPESEDAVPITVISEVPGESLLDFSWEAKGNDVYIAMQLVLEGVARLHALTSTLQQESVTNSIPVKTLMGELEEIQRRGGEWLTVAEFREALKCLEKRLPAVETPLVFSSGDYNPGNFLFSRCSIVNEEDLDHLVGNPGNLVNMPFQLTGFVDFSWACFEDPHIGFAKYWTYDWFPAGMIERYLYVNQLSPREFAPRLALRCLWTLQREVAPPTIDEGSTRYRANLLGLLKSAMALI